MKTKKILLLAAVLTAVIAVAFTGTQNAFAGKEKVKKNDFTDTFFLDDCTFSSTGSNRFFVLEPGFQSVFEGENEKLTITVLDETREVDGVVTRVVEEREEEGGDLVEVSRNFFAICEETNSVFYFGEEVDFYENGVIVDHHGSWLAGEDGARAGLMMPGTVLLGSKYFQEIAPGVAMDRAEIQSMSIELDTPAGEFENVLKTKETTPLEPGVKEFKYYADGIGLIKDGDLELVSYNSGE